MAKNKRIKKYIKDFPEALRLWDYRRNTCNPQELTSGSGRRVWWVCGKNPAHIYQARVVDVVIRGRRCPFCFGHKVGCGNDLLSNKPKLCEGWHPTKNKKGPEMYTYGSHAKVWWLCKDCGGEWAAAINNRSLGGDGCPYCSGNKIGYGNDLLTNFPELCVEWDYSKNKLRPENYTPGTSYKASWLCNKCGHKWKASINDRSGKLAGCPLCSKGQVSKVSQVWLDELSVSKREIWIKELGVRVDGFDPETNTVYEFLGDYWHGNPKKYPKNAVHPIVGVTYSKLYRKTIERLEKLRECGYNVEYIWESDFIGKAVTDG